MNGAPAAADTTADAAADAAPATPPAARKRGGGLSSMLLADLRSMASGLGVSGAGSMKKAELVAAIKEAQSGSAKASPDTPTREGSRQDRPSQDAPAQAAP